MSEADIRQERLRKIDALKAAGMDAYPAHTSRDTSVADFTATFEDREKSSKQSILAGRIMSLRGQGGILFGDLFDGSGRVQIVFQKNEETERLFSLFVDVVDKGDFIEVAGVAYTTKRGERSLNVSSWKMLAKSITPIPDEWFGLKDEEKKLRERDIDILLDSEKRALFERKSLFWNAIRQFYLSRGFVEVETPVLESTPGGADARPFATHHNALDIDVYLRISCGELWQKRLLIAGFPKVFEIGRIFRNEGQSREHLQDYTQIESYEAFADAAYGKQFLQDLYRHVAKEVYGKYTFEIGAHTVDLAEEWKTIDFCEAVEKEFGVHPVTCSEDEAIKAAKAAGVVFGEAPNRSRAVDHLWKKIRKNISGPAFLTGVPVFLEPLAKRRDDNPNLVDRIQVVIAGSEVGKGYSELNDPLDQRARFEEQQALRDAGDDEAQRMDDDYVHAMEYGMPPAFGFGVSERLFSFLENKPIHECQLFPLLRPQSSSKNTQETMIATIVLNVAALGTQWEELNTTAHLAASFAAREGRALFWRDSVTTKDGVDLPLNIQHAIMIKTTKTSSDLHSLISSAQATARTCVPFTREMLATTNDRKVAALTADKNESEIEYMGVLVFGNKNTVDSLTKEYPLHQ